MTQVNALNQRSTTVYDNAGRPVASVNPLGYRATTVYDAAGQAKASVDPLARRTTMVYDAAGQNTAVINPLGNRTTTLYDLADQARANTDALGYRTTSLFDELGRTRATVNAANGRTSVVYDAAVLCTSTNRTFPREFSPPNVSEPLKRPSPEKKIRARLLSTSVGPLSVPRFRATARNASQLPHVRLTDEESSSMRRLIEFGDPHCDAV